MEMEILLDYLILDVVFDFLGVGSVVVVEGVGVEFS